MFYFLLPSTLNLKTKIVGLLGAVAFGPCMTQKWNFSHLKAMYSHLKSMHRHLKAMHNPVFDIHFISDHRTDGVMHAYYFHVDFETLIRIVIN